MDGGTPQVDLERHVAKVSGVSEGSSTSAELRLLTLQ